MFAGIGGFRTGLSKLGDIFMPVGWCEIDRYAAKAYRTLYDTGGEYYCEDATRIDTDELPSIDLICAGFPCQPFSVAGRRLGFADTRGTLFHEIVRVAEAKRPKYLLLENVPGILNHNGGQTFLTILTTIHELGYGLEWCVLNSSDHGVPQQRKRVYIVGYLDQRLSGKIFPVGQSRGSNLIKIAGGSQGSRIYFADGESTCLTSQGGGWGAKTGLYFIDMNPDPRVTYSHVTDNMRYDAADKIDTTIGRNKGKESSSKKKPESVESTEKFEAYKGKKRKPGTGYVKQISANCWQGRYTPTIDGKRVSKNVYGTTEEECEKKLADLISEMKEVIKNVKMNNGITMA